MFSRLVLRNGAAITNMMLRTATPSISAVPKMCLLHTSVQTPMPHKLPETGGKVRFGFIPDEWFLMFHNKTGVTGPYVFGFGMVMYLLNKEIYVVGPETVHAFVAIGLLVYAVKKFGPGIAQWADDKRDGELKDAYASRNNSIAQFEDGIAEEKKEQWRLDGRGHLFDAKRENIQMQLELEYRNRLQEVADTVSQKLDLQVNLENLKRRTEQQHMVKWIEENVLKSISPQQESEILNKCLTDLKTLARV